MVTYAGIRSARPEQWQDAADDYEALASYVNQAAFSTRGESAAKVDAHWADSTGQAAAAKLYGLSDKLDSACDILAGVKMVLVGMHSVIQTAQATLDEAVRLANEYGISLDDQGRITGTATPDYVVSEIAGLIGQAVDQVTEADEAARAELAELRAAVGVTDPKKALDLQNEASHTEMDELAGSIPTGQSKAVVQAWWSGLTAQEQHDLMLAEPVALTNLDGIPESVKDEMRGPDPTKLDRVKVVDYALRNWNTADPQDFGDNCTNFVSEALRHGGMQNKVGTWTGMRSDDSWGKESGTGWDWWDQKMYLSHSWAGAENQQNFMLKHGEEVPQEQVRPGDIVYYEQQGPNPAIEQGKTHHAAVVTAVMPDGEIKYTQHSDSYQNVSIQGRLPHETESEGLQNLRFVRPEPDWY